MKIYITGLFEMVRYVRELAPTHLISIIQPEFQPPRPRAIAPDNHLRVQIHDIAAPDRGAVMPGPDHVASLIHFLRAWDERGESLLVHCYAGVSRSTAAALIAHYIKSGDVAHSARLLRRAAPHARPNLRILDLADDLLSCDGAMRAARDVMGPAEPWFEERLSTLEVDARS